MALSSKQPGDKLPIKEYLKATDAVSRPLAILLTLVVLFVCAALIFSLFLGGRWVYRNVSNNLNKSDTVKIDESDQEQANSDSKEEETKATPTPSLSPSTAPTATPKPSVTPTPTSVSSETSQSNIPNTGPEPE